MGGLLLEEEPASELKKEENQKLPVVQWLRLHTPNARDPGLIPGWGAKMLHDAWGQLIKKKKKKKTN